MFVPDGYGWTFVDGDWIQYHRIERAYRLTGDDILMLDKFKDVQVKTLKCFQNLWIDVTVFSFTHFFTEVEGRFLVGMRLCLSPTVSTRCFAKTIFMEWIIGREMFLTLLYNPFHFKFIGDPQTIYDRTNLDRIIRNYATRLSAALRIRIYHRIDIYHRI